MIVYLDGRDQCPYFLLRTFHMGGPWYSRYGAHELVIERDHCSLRFKRWSKTEGCSKLWAILHFMTWEGTFTLGVRGPDYFDLPLLNGYLQKWY